jgi:hypothetical protein
VEGLPAEKMRDWMNKGFLNLCGYRYTISWWKSLSHAFSKVIKIQEPRSQKPNARNAINQSCAPVQTKQPNLRMPQTLPLVPPFHTLQRHLSLSLSLSHFQILALRRHLHLVRQPLRKSSTVHYSNPRMILVAALATDNSIHRGSSSWQR